MRRVLKTNKTTLGFPAVALVMLVGVIMLFADPESAKADHNSLHTTPCDEADVVGGGASGNSSRTATIVGPPNSLGWEVGDGQCNGSFTVTSDASFPSLDGDGIELGLRIEERRVGQVQRIGGNEYQVELGNDTTAPPALNRAWWNFQHSIAYDGDINSLDALTFTIVTHSGPNLPAFPSFDMLVLRGLIDDRNDATVGNPTNLGTPFKNSTSTYSDLYQTSQNPEFGSFTPTSDTDANPNGRFNYDEEGAWQMTLTAEKDGQIASVSICVHTPNAHCLPDHFACYDVKEETKLPKGLEVNLSDQFTTEEGVKIKKVKEICVPVNKNGEGVLNPAFHLVCYDVKSKEKEKVNVLVTNQFTGDQPQELKIKNKKIKRLCVPSFKEVISD